MTLIITHRPEGWRVKKLIQGQKPFISFAHTEEQAIKNLNIVLAYNGLHKHMVFKNGKEIIYDKTV